MPTLVAIKAAVRKLPVKDRTDLLESIAMDEAVYKEQHVRLRAAIEEGIRDHKEGRFIEIKSAAEHRAFFDEIKRRARARLKQTA